MQTRKGFKESHSVLHCKVVNDGFQPRLVNFSETTLFLECQAFLLVGLSIAFGSWPPSWCDGHTAAFSLLHPIPSGKGSVINPTEQRGQSSVDLSFSWGHLANLRDASSFTERPGSHLGRSRAL